MVGVTGKGPRAHRAKAVADTATSTAAIAAADPAVQAAGVVPAPPADVVPPVEAAVEPDPTIVARPDAPLPIVTASPVLAAEPTATDVQRDALAATDPAAVPTGDPAVVAGQPTIAIEPARSIGEAGRRIGELGMPIVQAAVRGIGGAEQLPGATDAVADPSPPVAGQHRDDAQQREAEALLDRLDREGWPLGGRPVLSAAARATIGYVEVVGPQQGRRRAGRLFGPTATRFYEGEISDDELKLIRNDPQLSCAVGELPVDLAPYP